jgi:sulfate adenylyltransferase subunit 2
MRVFPLSNWSELDIWEYVREERIPIVPLYFAEERRVRSQFGVLVLVPPGGQDAHSVSCRFRTLGCVPCTGAIPSRAATLDAIVAEVAEARTTERRGRAIDLTGESSMEQKKRAGYF